jgi:hypothetical protein
MNHYRQMLPRTYRFCKSLFITIFPNRSPPIFMVIANLTAKNASDSIFIAIFLNYFNSFGADIAFF